MALSAAIFLFIAQSNVPSPPSYELMKDPTLAALLEHEYNQQRLLAFTFGILGVLCCSLAVGSVVGIFFHRPRHDYYNNQNPSIQALRTMDSGNSLDFRFLFS